MPSWQASEYSIATFPGAQGGVRAAIRLEDQSGSNALHAYFTTEDPLPSNVLNANFYFLYYPHDMFLPMMEMVREEAPVWVHALDELNVQISTHEEPIGEDEGP